MSQLVERKGFKIESTLPQTKKTKEKKAKPKVTEHVKIIDDDALIPWNAVIETAPIHEQEIISVEDAPIVVGIIDERPSEIREKERFENMKRWRTGAFETIPEPGSVGPQLKPGKSSSSSKSRQKRNESDDSDPEIDRRQSRANDSPDLSPSRRKNQHNNNNDDPSPPRRRRQLDDDPSPPRRHDSSHSQQKNKYSNDSSPPRRRDPSPPRKRQIKDDDSSPPRRRDRSPPSQRRHDRYPRQESSPSSSHRHQPKQEPPSPSSTHRRQPKGELSSSPSSHHPSKQEAPPPSSQPAKSERRRLAEHKEQLAERYTQWGRGIAQVRRAEDTVKDYLEQAQKPLARYADDTDLDSMLKQKEREDDPMLKYLTKKSSDGGDRSNNSAPAKPRYRGPDPQKNRFDIWPGYRWDGVDRSNGYEKKLFESIANRHAKAQEAYLWSVEDM